MSNLSELTGCSTDLEFERWWIKFYDEHYLENALKPDVVIYKKIARYAWNAAKEKEHINASCLDRS